MKATDAFKLTRYAARSGRGETLVGDEDTLFWVPTVALDEDVDLAPGATPEQIVAAYDRWCHEWPLSAASDADRATARRKCAGTVDDLVEVEDAIRRDQHREAVERFGGRPCRRCGDECHPGISALVGVPLCEDHGPESPGDVEQMRQEEQMRREQEEEP